MAFSSWSAPEKWVWQRVCEGAVADFNSHYGVTLNPRNRIGWSKTREIGTEFMHDVLASKHLRDAVGGVASIKGAWFREPVRLSGIAVNGVLRLEGSRFESTLELNHTKVAHRISLDGSKVSGAVYMHSLDANGSTSMRGGEYSDIILSGAKIGTLELIGSKVTGSLDMSAADIRNDCHVGKSDVKDIFLNGAKVGGDLFMNEGKFGDVNLYSARVGGQLHLQGATFRSTLLMASIDVGRALLMHQDARFKDVMLSGAKVGSNLHLNGSTVTGILDMSALRVGTDLSMYNSDFKEVSLNAAKIGSNLDLIGSVVTKHIMMSRIDVGNDLLMDKAKLGEVDLSGSKIGALLSLKTAKVSGPLHMDSLEVEGALVMDESAEFADIYLGGAKVRGPLSLRSTKVAGFIDMDSLEVDGELLMDDKSEFGTVSLRNATITDNAALNGAKLGGDLNMDSADIRGDLQMDSGHFRDVSLYGTKIAGDLSLVKSEITNSFLAGFTYVGGLVVLEGAQMPPAVEIFDSHFGSDLVLSGTQLTELRLKGTKIAGELILGTKDLEPPHWTPEKSVVSLRNTSADSLRFRYDSWPDQIDIEGFTYNRIRQHLEAPVPDVSASPGETMPVREAIDSLKEWLEKNKQYSPQPYMQLASVLRSTGLSAEANDILYAGKERERSMATGAWWLWLTLLDWTIGYGYGLRYFRSLGSIAILVGFGTIVLWGAGELRRPKQKLGWGIIYSLDMLLPFDLDKSHDAIELGLCARRYFYVHKILGYVLSGFIIAGLAGITK